MGLLRLLLSLSVLAAHTQYWPKYFHGVGGLSAVEIFFVISGFYMSLVLSKTYKGNRRAFYINRILRIYPLFYIVLIATFILDIFQNSNFISSLNTLPNLGLLLVICSNLIIFGSDLLMFLSFQSGHLALVPFHQASTSLGGGAISRSSMVTSTRTCLLFIRAMARIAEKQKFTYFFCVNTHLQSIHCRTFSPLGRSLDLSFYRV